MHIQVYISTRTIGLFYGQKKTLNKRQRLREGPWQNCVRDEQEQRVKGVKTLQTLQIVPSRTTFVWLCVCVCVCTFMDACVRACAHVYDCVFRYECACVRIWAFDPEYQRTLIKTHVCEESPLTHPPTSTQIHAHNSRINLRTSSFAILSSFFDKQGRPIACTIRELDDHCQIHAKLQRAQILSPPLCVCCAYACACQQIIFWILYTIFSSSDFIRPTWIKLSTVTIVLVLKCLYTSLWTIPGQAHTGFNLTWLFTTRVWLGVHITVSSHCWRCYWHLVSNLKNTPSREILLGVLDVIGLWMLNLTSAHFKVVCCL